MHSICHDDDDDPPHIHNDKIRYTRHKHCHLKPMSMKLRKPLRSKWELLTNKNTNEWLRQWGSYGNNFICTVTVPSHQTLLHDWCLPRRIIGRLFFCRKDPNDRVIVSHPESSRLTDFGRVLLIRSLFPLDDADVNGTVSSCWWSFGPGLTLDDGAVLLPLLVVNRLSLWPSESLLRSFHAQRSRFNGRRPVEPMVLFDERTTFVDEDEWKFDQRRLRR